MSATTKLAVRQAPILSISLPPLKNWLLDYSRTPDAAEPACSELPQIDAFRDPGFESSSRPFPDGRPLGPRLRLQRLRIPPRRSECNDFHPTSEAASRPVAA